MNHAAPPVSCLATRPGVVPKILLNPAINALTFSYPTSHAASCTETPSASSSRPRISLTRRRQRSNVMPVSRGKKAAEGAFAHHGESRPLPGLPGIGGVIDQALHHG